MLSIKNLHKNYKEKEVLKGVDLNIKQGEIKALIGVNGSGKSTLVEIVCGVKCATCGDVSVNNININDKKSRNSLKHIIGYVPQSFSLFNDLTVRENLSYIGLLFGLNSTVVDWCLSLCSLQEYANVLAENLSGGYKQLLSIACAILNKPKFLILDEPTSAMDPIFRKHFWDIVNATKEWGATVLIITHYLEELFECDTFACLYNGKICYDGKVTDFKKDGFIDIEQILSKYSVGARWVRSLRCANLRQKGLLEIKLYYFYYLLFPLSLCW